MKADSLSENPLGALEKTNTLAETAKKDVHCLRSFELECQGLNIPTYEEEIENNFRAYENRNRNKEKENLPKKEKKVSPLRNIIDIAEKEIPNNSNS